MEKGTYRIIDANFNRAREGFRLAEDFCRFSLDSEPLTARCKSLRHQLSEAVIKLDAEKLITARDTDGDVGCGLEIKNQLKRAGFRDCLNAAFARAGEAVRVISELIAAEDTELARTIEKIRYQAYSLQKEIIIVGLPAEKFKRVRLYCIIGTGFEKSPLSLARACATGGADCVQLRLKNIPDKEFLETAAEFVRICKENGVISIINDRVDIACVTGADGVHLGQDDISAQQARKFQTRPLIIGISTHSLSELENAIEQDPAYIATGAVFETETKKGAECCGLEYVKQAKKILEQNSIQQVAVGGINFNNINTLLSIPVKTVAVSSVVCGDEQPQKICAKLKALIKSES